MSSSITIRPADDLISGRDRLLHRWRCVGGSNRVPELCGRGPPRNIMVDVGRRCFTTGEQNNQTEPTENSTKRQHGRERATIRSRNSRSYEERSGGVSVCRRVGACYPEGVRELSPGWRLCGTLGRGVLCDLPRRGNRFNARDSASDCERLFYRPFSSSNPAGRVFFTVGTPKTFTQGSAKPPPWAKSCTPSG